MIQLGGVLSRLIQFAYRPPEPIKFCLISKCITKGYDIVGSFCYNCMIIMTNIT